MKNPTLGSPDPKDRVPAPAGERKTRRAWVAPAIEALPPLNRLTLQSEDIGGGEGVFP